MTRTFVALELDRSLQGYLDTTIGQLARQLPHLRWVHPTGVHLTLAFLGELTDEQIAQVIEASDEAAHQFSPFDFRLSHLGTFGSPRQPRVVWIGIDEPSGTLKQLHRVLNRQLVQRGFEVDTRPFSPHLTLSRIKSPLKPDELQVLQRLTTDRTRFSASPVAPVRHVSVMKSELLRSGAQYTCLHQSSLGL